MADLAPPPSSASVPAGVSPPSASSHSTVQLSGAYDFSTATHPPYKIEYATGNRNCKGPQPCNGSIIEAGALQVATWWGDCPWGPRWIYRHWHCMTPTVFRNVHDKIGNRVDDFPGFSSLSLSDQAHVRMAYDAGTPTGISRLTAAEIKTLLKRAGIKQSGDKGMITERATSFFIAGGLSLEGSLQELQDRIEGYVALAAKGMLPAPAPALAPVIGAGVDIGEGSSTGGMHMEIGGSAMMDFEVDEKKPQLNSDTEDEELDEKKPHIKSDSEDSESFSKPCKKRKRTTKKPAKPRVKKEPVNRRIVVKPLAVASSTQPTRRSRRLNGDELGIDDAAAEAGPSSLPALQTDANGSFADVKQEVFAAKIEHQEEEGIVASGLAPSHEEEENVAPKVEEGLVSLEAQEAVATEGRVEPE